MSAKTVTITVDKIKKLPLIDVSVFDIISLLDNPQSDFKQIIERLSPDIAARFLIMANSARYGREVRSINHAVRLLGYKEMKQILTTSIVIDHFVKRLENFRFDKFQKQAHFCAAISRALGQMLDYEHPEHLFTVAMLQNIGKLVIAVYFEDDHKRIIVLKKSGDISTSEAEQRILGVAHAEVGALVLERLGIPEDICDAVRYHHTYDRIMPEVSNFRLELITRESAKLIGRFILPEDMEPMELIGRLKGPIEDGQRFYREGVRKEMQTQGLREIYPALVKQASHLLYRNLKPHLQKRAHYEKAEIVIRIH
jgi:HD-like signal output (HDOD) protein